MKGLRALLLRCGGVASLSRLGYAADLMASLIWQVIRDRYIVLLHAAKRAGIRQEDIAARGGLHGQNAISKLVANDNLGPSVETFVRAVEGLGKPVSIFFAELEAQVLMDDHA